jgi:ribosomal protein S18 acetylase RimI-like enzyme
MSTPKPYSTTLRPAQLADAPVLAQLVNYAGEGMPLYLWEKLAADGQTVWDVGRRRAERETGSFSYRNATNVESIGTAAGALIGYEIAKEPEPVPSDMPAMFVPLQELENLAPDTWYVNVLAVLPQFRGTGLGSRLLALADETGERLKKSGMSVIVADNNTGARRLYERFGYAEAGRRPIAKEGWQTEGREWMLLTKEF